MPLICSATHNISYSCQQKSKLKRKKRGAAGGAGGQQHYPESEKMGRRPPCCPEEGVNRGAWSAVEDQILINYINNHGEGDWRNVPKRAGLLRCGKSCRLRWLNYLRPDIKRGNFSNDEQELIIRLHNLLGNRWALIAGRLPGRTDNEIKNYWHATLSKKMPKNNNKNNNNNRPCRRYYAAVLDDDHHHSDQAAASAFKLAQTHEVARPRAIRCTKVVIPVPSTVHHELDDKLPLMMSSSSSMKTGITFAAAANNDININLAAPADQFSYNINISASRNLMVDIFKEMDNVDHHHHHLQYSPAAAVDHVLNYTDDDHDHVLNYYANYNDHMQRDQYNDQAAGRIFSDASHADDDIDDEEAALDFVAELEGIISMHEVGGCFS
ncbi:hypothetical protein Dimus_002696 [Dionaea muscipula]